VVTSDPLVPLGVIVGAHGVRGELRVKLHNPGSDLLASQRTVTLRRDPPGATSEGQASSGPLLEQRRVLSRRWHKDLLLLMLERCDDRDTAQAMRGIELCVVRSALPKLDEGEHYLIDLVGLRAQLPSGELVGRVQAVIPYPTAEVLCVRSERGLIEVPMFAPYVVETRIADGCVVVDHLDDLVPEPSSSKSSRQQKHKQGGK
jgi:16S rRNA processing protein RimM